MILALDVYYEDEKAKVVGVLFEDWASEQPIQVLEEWIAGVAAYESGQFYKRELPCLMQILAKVKLIELAVIVIDGYVWLDTAGKKGLGAYLHEALDPKIPVLGVAKTKFAGSETVSQAILRGKSQTPLYISAQGLPLETAATYIQSMAGAYRIPTLLKYLDQQTRA